MLKNLVPLMVDLWWCLCCAGLEERACLMFILYLLGSLLVSQI